MSELYSGESVDVTTLYHIYGKLKRTLYNSRLVPQQTLSAGSRCLSKQV